MKPILFNTEMVRAVLDGRKTVTRRVVKNMDICRFQPGDILYVRETWQFVPCIDCGADEVGLCSERPVTYEDAEMIGEGCFVYRAEEPQPERMVWHPSIHMPKAAARIFLWVKAVRVERLRDIDDDGVVAEGMEIGDPFDELWDSTIKPAARDKYGWAANPWVWVIEFERCEKPEEG